MWSTFGTIDGKRKPAGFHAVGSASAATLPERMRGVYKGLAVAVSGRQSTMKSMSGSAPPKQYRPHPSDEAEVRAAFAEAERGEVLTAEESESVIRWLESGEGPCPWRDGSRD